MLNPSPFQLFVTWIVVVSAIAAPMAAFHFWQRKHRESDERLLIAGPVVFVGLLGYLAFFVCFASPLGGKIYSFGILLAALTSVVLRTRSPSQQPRSDAITTIALLVFGIGLLDLTLLYLPDLGLPFARQSAERFLQDLPCDPELPQFLGDRVYAGAPLRPFFIDWLSSDRPPLQAGLYLLVLPWLNLARLPIGLGYQCVGTLAQLAWVPAVWLLAVSFRLRQMRRFLLILTLATSGFVFLNTIYVWPKLLAAGYVLIAAILLLDRSAPLTAKYSGFAAGAAALGWLAHGGAAFSLVALAPFCLLLGRSLWKRLPVFVGVFMLIALPWSFYQKFCDPPGDRLLKYHLANVTTVDSRTAWQTIREAYAPLTWRTWLANKRANLDMIAGGSYSNIFNVFTSTIHHRRVDEFFRPLRSLGILNLGWLAAPIAWLFKRFRPTEPAAAPTSPQSPHSLWQLVFCWMLLTALVWVLAMFRPASTTIHQGSYAMMLAAFCLVIVSIIELPIYVTGAILGWHLLYFAATWLPIYGSARLDFSLFLLFPIGVAPFVFAGWQAFSADRRQLR